MTLGHSFRTCFGAYADLFAGRSVAAGRASRSEFWWFQTPWLLLCVFVPFSFAIIVPSINRHGHLTGEAVIFYPYFVATYLAFAAYLVAALIPTVAVLMRRLHDTGRTGWWSLLFVVPFGALVLLVFLVQRGTPGANAFGPNPLKHGT